MNKNGIIVIDKPEDISSASVVAKIKRLFNAKKAGHAGTLDPFATGVLVCCINKATRVAGFLSDKNKKYLAIVHLGIATDTQDFTGSVISECKEFDFNENTIQSVFKSFIGPMDQVPPVYSALKHRGIPLYKLARRGTPVQKPARRIFISDINIRNIDLPEICFQVSCSAGTYIRTLCADIGTALGCGGHLKKLTRIESSGFSIKQAFTLSELEQSAASGKLSDHIIDMAHALSWMPECIADDGLTEKIRHGMSITTKEINTVPKADSKGFIKVVDNKEYLIAILELKKNSEKYDYCCVLI
jgi:tRNA pseudouridine55 synthase